MYKRIVLLLLVMFNTPMLLFACEVCSKNQPAGLENVTHGAGPEGYFDYVIGYVALAIVLFTLFLSIKYLVRPGEHDVGHIKNIVCNENS
jgi:hypothetical protein